MGLRWNGGQCDSQATKAEASAVTLVALGGGIPGSYWVDRGYQCAELEIGAKWAD
jgi:hypothetical protein